MNSELIKSLLEILKLAPRYLVPVGLSSALLLFPGRNFLNILGLAQFAENNRPLIGAAFIVSLAVTFCWAAEFVYRYFVKIRQKRHIEQKILERLHALTKEEKQILGFYIENQTRTNYLRANDGVVQGLKAAGIIHLAAPYGSFIKGIAFNISEIAWQYLNQNPRLFSDGTTNVWTTHQNDSIHDVF